MYIALEGIDTAGKTTQLEKLKYSFSDAMFTQEPPQSIIGSKIRDIILQNDIDSKCEFFLFLSSRAQHISDTILPNIDKVIISDRSLISGMAYAQDMSRSDIISFNKSATGNILPDKVVILFLDKDELEKRLSQKTNDKIEKRGIDYLLEIQNKMIDFCEALSLEYIKINANNTVENISSEITDFIKE